ncbi:hypothetical protein BGX24_012075 [Mortierella sp. AD032]|nr:hypothetical protein BGX24_012075 [Mortierella sp. AD032]
MARFTPIAVTVIFLCLVQLQRVAACFTSTTILVQLAFYIWAIEGVFKASLIVATIATVSFYKDFNEKMQAWRLANSQGSHLSSLIPVGFYVSFVVGVGLRMILNELRKRDNEIQYQRELRLRLEKDMPPLPATTTTKKSSSSFMDQILMESEVQIRLLRVRTWPRIVTGLRFVVLTVGTFIVAPDILGKVHEMSWSDCAVNVLTVALAPLGFYALLRKSLRASRWILWATMLSAIHEGYTIIKDLVAMYSQKHQSAALSFITTVTVAQDHSVDDKANFTKLLEYFVFSTVYNLIAVWSIWQVVKDLERRDQRVAETMAKTKVESAAANSDDQLDTSCSEDSSQQPSVAVNMPVAQTS